MEDTFGPCKLHKQTFTNCGVRHTKLENGDVTLDQDEYIDTLRPIVSDELTGRSPNDEATVKVASLFTS